MDTTQKIQKISATDQVFDRLKGMITDGTWSPGEKIPTEKQLAEDFGVNRLTVRIALQRLQSIGLVEILVGNGTYVKQFDLEKSILDLSEFYSESQSLEDVQEYRTIIEKECLKLAVLRRTEEDLAQYRDILAAMKQDTDLYFSSSAAVDKDSFIPAQAELSLDIHTCICRMAHNTLLDYAFAIAKGPFRLHMIRNIVSRTARKSEADKTLENYRILGEQIEARNLEGSLATLEAIMNR